MLCSSEEKACVRWGDSSNSPGIGSSDGQFGELEEMPMPESDKGRRFGTVAIEMGFATVDQVLTAMNIQVWENIENGEHRLLGMILVEMGVMKRSQVTEVLLAMGVPM